MDNVKQFSSYNLFNVPEGLRKLALDIEEGRRPCKQALICMADEHGNIDYASFGREFYWLIAVGLATSVAAKIARTMGNG